ncbi:hypothetical protein GJ496_009192 [Pomphorhynchus laevis]|nr:hypothetical protein GJ496_009192 [Pomphorhynchus laevis]
MKSNEMEHLPHFHIEIRGQPVVFGDYNHFAYCVISYLVAYYANQDNSLSYCADSTHRIYVDGRDQNGNLKWPRDEEVEVSTISGPHFIDHDIAKDNFLTRESLPFHRYSDNSSEHHSSDEESSQFEIICTHANNSAHLTGLSYIDSKVIAFTILIKSIGQNLKEPGEGKVVLERSLSNRSTPLNSNLACLLEPRAGFALIEWNSSLLAIGGFNSGACLHTVEYLNKETNEWERWPSMKGRRGRCFAARINGSFGIFAGSNGAQHLTDCEILDPQTQTWSILNNFRLPFAHSVVVAGDNDIIYAICGSNEGDPSSLCYKYCLKTKVWQSIASTNYERVNPTAVWHEGSLFVFGGNSTWRCLRKCEVYKPDTDTWLELPSLPDPRRSAGITSFNGKIYLIGGTDGTITMSAVDILNTDTMKWEKGPELLCRRSSAGVTTKDGYIFVVGGFDGHTFKRTTELYDGISWNLLENDHTNEIDIFTCHQE